MTSYILGDLDISENEEEASEFGSLELSSNSGTEGSYRGPANHEEAFGGFISKQSPFSFKNPIFFSCPNQKIGMARKIPEAQVGNCRKQLFTKQIQKLQIKEIKTPVIERKPLKIQTEQMHKLQQDIVESPISKNKYKNIAREMKECEKANDSYQMVVKTVLTKMITAQMPKKIQWRVYLDLADYAKRESKFDESRYLFKIVVSQQPYAYQGWLEYAKMEEECGNQEQSRDILLKGLHFNPFSENLFIKAVKIEEKMNNFDKIREMVENIRGNKDISIEKCWRILLEGALFEGRCGNRAKAR